MENLFSLSFKVIANDALSLAMLWRTNSNDESELNIEERERSDLKYFDWIEMRWNLLLTAAEWITLLLLLSSKVCIASIFVPSKLVETHARSCRQSMMTKWRKSWLDWNKVQCWSNATAMERNSLDDSFYTNTKNSFPIIARRRSPATPSVVSDTKHFNLLGRSIRFRSHSRHEWSAARLSHGDLRRTGQRQSSLLGRCLSFFHWRSLLVQRSAFSLSAGMFGLFDHLQ